MMAGQLSDRRQQGYDAGNGCGRGTWGSKGGGSDSGTQGTASLGAPGHAGRGKM